jgi:hypothetical protein
LCAYDARLSLAKRGFCPCDVFAGWKHGKAAPAARKAAGLPSVDAQRLVQHDVFNLVVLPVLMVLNIGSWLGLVSHYLYTVLFAAYIGADFLYIWAWPEAVPQPSLVLAHHSFVLALLSHPLRDPLTAPVPATVSAPPPPAVLFHSCAAGRQACVPASAGSHQPTCASITQRCGRVQHHRDGGAPALC